MTFYHEALKQDETHERSMLALAKLHLRFFFALNSHESLAGFRHGRKSLA